MTLAAFVRGDAPEEAEQKSWRRWGLGLVVPVAAGAAAVAIWIAVPQPTPPAAAPVQVRQAPATAPSSGGRVSPADPAPAAVIPPPAGELAAALDSERLPSREKREASASPGTAAANGVVQPTIVNGSAAITAGASPRPAATAVPAAPSDAAETIGALRTLASRLAATSTVIASPDSSVLWRFVGGRALQYSATGGRQWETLDIDVNVELTAGASSGASVCWLVGRGGTVLRTIDGRRFQRIPFPEAVDLISVASASDTAATVTASDGRVFRTADGGVTWN
jgi:hypothetical protein